MTNESYILVIVGFCHSILMNLSFRKKKLGSQAPQLTMGATLMNICIFKNFYMYVPVHSYICTSQVCVVFKCIGFRPQTPLFIIVHNQYHIMSTLHCLQYEYITV